MILGLRQAQDDSAMMARKQREQGSLFYEFRLEDMVPKGHLLRQINVFVTSALSDLHKAAFTSRPVYPG